MIRKENDDDVVKIVMFHGNGFILAISSSVSENKYCKRFIISVRCKFLNSFNHFDQCDLLGIVNDSYANYLNLLRFFCSLNSTRFFT